MKTTILTVAALYGGLSVLFGAFGAHALKKIFAEDQQKSFETGVKYQMYHAIVLLVIGFQFSFQTSLERIMGWCFVVGVFLFSFSIYGLCISSAKGSKMKFLGPITPLGGLLLLLGWAILLVQFIL